MMIIVLIAKLYDVQRLLDLQNNLTMTSSGIYSSPLLSLSPALRSASTGSSRVMPTTTGALTAHDRRSSFGSIEAKDSTAHVVQIGHTRKDALSQASNRNIDETKADLTGTVLNLLKAIIGAGCLALPMAFQNMGPAAASVTILLIGSLSIYTINLLIDVKNEVVFRQANGYLTTTETTLLLPISSPSLPTRSLQPTEERRRAESPHTLSYLEVMTFVYGAWGYNIAFFLLLFTSIGVSASYITFFTQTMSSLLPSVSPVIFGLVAGAVVYQLSLFRSFRHLSRVSLLGLVSLAFGVVIVSWYGLKDPELSVEDILEQPLVKVDTYLLSFGTLGFLFCVHFLIFPIENGMAEPAQFGKAVSISVWIVSLFSVAFGFLSFMAFGADVSSIILENIPQDSVLMVIVRFSICFSLLAAYPLTLAPGRELLEEYAMDKLASSEEPAAENEKLRTYSRHLIIGGLVLCTVLLSQAKSFGLVTNLVGGFSMSILGFVIPPLMYLTLRGRKASVTRWALLLSIAAFGAAAAILTSWQSLCAIISTH